MHKLTLNILMEKPGIATVAFLLILSSALLAGQVDNTNVATLGVQSNYPLSIGTMGHKGRIYSNRRAKFTDVPDFLQGLQYTMHERKKIATISCQVKTSGRIYLCLFGEMTPKRVGQRRDWKKCGTISGLGFWRKKEWTIYQADVQAGQILTFPQADEFGLTVAAKEIIIEQTRSLHEMSTTLLAYRSIVGTSVQGRPVESFVLGEGEDVFFILAAIHGDEHMGITLVQKLAVYLHNHLHLLLGRKVILMPIANPDGVVHYTHENANDVNLNRNFDTSNRRNKKWAGPHALSEPETRIIKELIEKYKPNRIVSIHQVVGILGPKNSGMVDHDGPAEELAQRMSKYCKLPAKRWGTQPGSLGAYAGEMLGIPIVTLELPMYDVGLNSEKLWDEYGTALVAAVLYPDRIDKALTINEIERINSVSPVSK